MTPMPVMRAQQRTTTKAALTIRMLGVVVVAVVAVVVVVVVVWPRDLWCLRFLQSTL